MTQTEAYDWLLSERVREPACLVLGDRCIVGRWEEIAKIEAGDYMCRAGRVAIVVLGEGSNWIDAHAQAKARLEIGRHGVNHGEVAKPLP